MDDPQYIKCIGFQENVVLALKSCFYEGEIRCLRIEKLPDQSAAYHARSCMDLTQCQGSPVHKVSRVCNDWFNTLMSLNGSFSKDVMETELSDDNGNYDLEPKDNICDSPKSHIELENLAASDLNNTLEDDNQSVKSECFQENDKVSNLDRNVQCSLPMLQCSLCTLSFRKRPSLNKHMNRKHKMDLDIERDTGKHPCDECGKRFNKLPSLRRHKSRKHSLIYESRSLNENVSCIRNEAKYLNCDIEGCGSPLFDSELAWKLHLKDVHNLPRKGRKPKEPIDLDLMKTLELDISMKDQQFEMPQSCVNCGKVFESKLKMYWHIKRVHQQKHKPCHLCGLMVKKLSDHVKRQHTEKDMKKFVCEFCGERFKGHSGYQFHKAGHTGEKKYACRSCRKPFRTSSEAYNCERGHQGIFKWRCSLCSFKSHQKNKYIRHLRTHSKSQPYQCPLCDHRAARKDYLQKHIGKSHSHLTLDEVEASHPNLYRIEEKVQLTPEMHYEKLELANDSKLEKEEQSKIHVDRKCDIFEKNHIAGQGFKVEGVKTDPAFKNEDVKVGLTVPYHPPYHHPPSSVHPSQLL